MPCYSPPDEARLAAQAGDRSRYLDNDPLIKQFEGLVHWMEHLLCSSCKFLTIEQLNSVQGNHIYPSLLSWYRRHLHQDLKKEDCKISAESELKRLGE